MKRFHHLLLKGLLLLLLLPFILQKSLGAADNDSTIPLSAALKMVRDHYKVDILFEDKTVDGLSVPSGTVNFERSAEENLGALLRPFALHYKKVKARSYLIVSATVPAAAPAPVVQTGVVALPGRWITGTVTSTDGQALHGASVRVKGSGKGTYTDADGKFRLEVGPEDKVLLISFTGYAAAEIPIDNDMAVRLTAVASRLNDVVVIGYGTASRKNLISSVSTVKGSEVSNVPVTSIDAALQGKAAGVQVVENSGAPGDETYIRIRGNGSLFGENRPLYVIDGVPMNNLPAAQYGISGDGQRIAATNDINPNDIASIEVLKDAEASAIYGSRGANGVILITTKRGVAGKSKFTVSAYTGLASVTKRLNLLNNTQYVDLIKEERANAGLPADPTIAYTDTNTNWQNAIFRQAPITDANLSISGGTGKTSHYISLGYFDQTGTIVGLQRYKRWNGRVNFDFMATDDLKIGINLAGTHSINHRMDNSFSGQSVLAAALIENPNYPIYNRNGTYFSDPNRRVTNPVMLANSLRFVSDVDSYDGNIFGEYNILKGLKFKTSLGFDDQEVTDDRYQSVAVNNGSPASGFVSVFTQFLWLNENTLSYTLPLKGRHNFSALIGQSTQEAAVRRIGVSGSQSSTDIIQSVSGFTSLYSPTDYRSEWGLVSYFGRLNYSYNDRYLVEGVARTDGSSRFGANKRYGFFPSIAAGWRISNEAFMRDVKFVNDLKLRGSIGVTGNNEGLGSDFPSLATYSTGYNYGAEAGIAGTSLSNNDLSWESTVSSDLGLDMTFLDNRISVTVDAYDKVTNRLIFKLNLPYTSGYSRTNGANIGQMTNKGLEFLVNTDNIRGAFTWNTGTSLSINRNKITYLPETVAGDPSSSDFTESLPGSFYTSLPTSIYRVGAAVGSFFGYRSLGVNPSTGNMIYDDVNHDGKINANDRVIIGNALPKFTGSMTNTFGYKGFDFNFFFYWSYGNKVYNQTRVMLERMNAYNNGDTRTLNRWSSAHTVTDVPKAMFNDPVQVNSVTNGEMSSRFVEDGSYIRLKNVTLGYSIPMSRLRRFKVSSFRVYISGQNLLMITSYSGFDPESQNQSVKNSQLGIDWAVQPQPRTLLAGLSVNF
ncbi:SusC/RagA family TonB-linked outer membrane protein [Dinghuibacter silviterrae]|uniref:TonB-linked SusC/RagA family outer membrane protein n=1 Tax=Dinghuibacter silviterrae TaxID=1539049 RepID=A0A4R8DIC2_9BACT|nr:TonB-dependent receptor [Dinghuibacter silviterrae]TDW97483.1 TonB-linked SusC/RagA family outer membrane protein [Dinghuibacter silviterrae]